jgi:hypothetical protein
LFRIIGINLINESDPEATVINQEHGWRRITKNSQAGTVDRLGCFGVRMPKAALVLMLSASLQKERNVV